MITNPVRRANYIGSGITGPYSFTFRIFEQADLQVYKEDALGNVTLLQYLLDYTLAGVPIGNDTFAAGGIVTLFSPLALTESLTLLRNPLQTQPRSFANAGPFLPKNHENALDRLTMLIQGQQDALDRSIKQSVMADPSVELVLPPASASKLIGWDVTGSQLANWDNNFKEAATELFVNGIGFTTGVTLVLSLLAAPGTAANVLIFFDGVEQDHTKWSLNVRAITFVAPIVATKVEIAYRRVIDVSAQVGANTMDARQFGAIGNGDVANSAVDTIGIQNLINWSALTGGYGIVKGGTYWIDNLVIKDGTKLLMANNTYLRHKAGSTNHMLTLAPGVVQRVTLSGGKIRGNGNAGKHGIYFQAQPILTDGFVQGGLWYSLMDQLDVSGFLGEQVWLHATGDFVGPHQFLIFNNCQVANASTTTRALRLTGEVDQVEFIDGIYDGPGRSLGTENILIERTVDSVTGLNNGDLAPATINFRGFTSQSCNRIARVERASSVLFDGCNFQEAPEGILGDISVTHLKVINSQFQNIGHRDNGDGSGWAVKCNNGAVTVSGNTFVSSSAPVAPDTHYINTAAPNDFGLHVEGMHYDSTGIRTLNIMPQMGAATATVDVGGFLSVGIATSATPITTINSKHNTGVAIRIQATSGNVHFDIGGNLGISPFGTPFTLKQDAIATFMASDLGGFKWRLISVAMPLGGLRPPPIFVNSTGNVDPSGGTEFASAPAPVVRTLPALWTGPPGTRITIKKIDGTANAVTVANAESGTPYGLITPNQWVECEWDGTFWKVVGFGTTFNNAQPAVAVTPATAVSPFGYATQAQADAIVAGLNACIVVLKRINLLT